MRLNKTYISLLLTALLIPVGISPVSAQAAPALLDASSCTATDVEVGNCITAVVSAGEDPIIEGVQQTIMRGELEAAEQYVQQRSTTNVDATQDAIEALIAGENSNTPESSAKSSPQDARRDPNGVGTVIGTQMEVADNVDYVFCSATGCVVAGSVAVSFRMNINGNLDFTLAGDLQVTSGDPVIFRDVRCATIFDEVFDFDSEVHNWINCDRPESTVPASSGLILEENWVGGSLEATYHPEYFLSFENSAGVEFVKDWNAREYRIDASGFTFWL